MRAMLVALLLVATPALASPQHGEPAAPHGAKPTAAPAAHADEPKAAAHGGSKDGPKPAAHGPAAEKASAAYPSASVTVVRVPSCPRRAIVGNWWQRWGGSVSA